MKSLKEYLLEEKEEIIDEGLKDWIRKVAITAAVATSCLGGAAANKTTIDKLPNYTDKQQEYSINTMKKEATNSKDLKLTLKYVYHFQKNNDGTFTFTTTPVDLEWEGHTQGNRIAFQNLQNLLNALQAEWDGIEIIKNERKTTNSYGTDTSVWNEVTCRWAK